MSTAKRTADLTFCAFDVETTGISSFSRLVEVGAVRFRIGGEAEEYSTLVDPGQPIPAEATAVHGIDDKAVRGAPGTREALQELFTFSRGCLLVAHNAAFDVTIVSIEAARVGLRLPPGRVLDSMGLARSYMPGMRYYNLENLALHLGLDTFSLHRALPDARVTKAIVEACVTSVPGWEDTLPERIFAGVKTFWLSDFTVSKVSLPPDLAVLKVALERGRDVYIVYDGGTKGRTRRKITPTGLFARRGYIYLEAFCHLDNASKSFRVDRIISMETER